MKKYLLITPGYPDIHDQYNNGFVHTRVKNYLDAGIDVRVYSVVPSVGSDYVYENIPVMRGGYERLSEIVCDGRYDKFLIHFGYRRVVETILASAKGKPIIVWVHGVEALGWYRRLFNFKWGNTKGFMRYVVTNIRQMSFMHQFIRNNQEQVTFIFVSKWMKNILEIDSCSRNKIGNYNIIPNIIDEERFPYVPKKREDRLRILSVRPYTSRKYANDLMVKAIVALSNKPFFNELQFSIYGDGELFDKTVQPIRGFTNVHIVKKFLNHSQIAKLHEKHGVMLMPTRQDSQGVSTCEGMSSGLVPVSSENTALPEFVPKGCGYLTNNVKGLVSAIEDLYNQPSKYLTMSAAASEFIRKKCGKDTILSCELDIITG